MPLLRGKKDAIDGGKHIPDFLRVQPDEDEKKYNKVTLWSSHLRFWRSRGSARALHGSKWLRAWKPRHTGLVFEGCHVLVREQAALFR